MARLVETLAAAQSQAQTRRVPLKPYRVVRAKLSDDQIRSLYYDGMSYDQIAVRYGLNYVSVAKHGKAIGIIARPNGSNPKPIKTSRCVSCSKYFIYLVHDRYSYKRRCCSYDCKVSVTRQAIAEWSANYRTDLYGRAERHLEHVAPDIRDDVRQEIALALWRRRQVSPRLLRRIISAAIIQVCGFTHISLASPCKGETAQTFGERLGIS